MCEETMWNICCCVFPFCDVQNYHGNSWFLSWNIIEKSLIFFKACLWEPWFTINIIKTLFNSAQFMEDDRCIELGKFSKSVYLHNNRNLLWLSELNKSFHLSYFLCVCTGWYCFSQDSSFLDWSKAAELCKCNMWAISVLRWNLGSLHLHNKIPCNWGHKSLLTHWGRVTHICIVKLTIIGSDNGLSPGRRQAIIWTNAGILLIGPLGTNFIQILIGIQTFPFKKMHLKMSSAKWRPFCLGLNELKQALDVPCVLCAPYMWVSICSHPAICGGPVRRSLI